MDDDLKTSLTTGETWIRGLYMILFFIIYSIVELIAFAIAIFQFAFLLFTREPSDRLTEFGDDITVYIYQIWQFLTVNSEERPWPFAPWPDSADSLDVPPVPAEEDVPPAAPAPASPVAEASAKPAGPDMTDGGGPVTGESVKPAGPDMTDADNQGHDDGIKKD